jgi:hypothetical protein
LQEWNRRWGLGVSFLDRAADVFLGIGLVEVPADRAYGELLDIIRKGRKALSQLESIAFINSHSIKVNQFPGFWIEINHVIEGLYERIAQADAVLQLQLCLDTYANMLICTY